MPRLLARHFDRPHSGLRWTTPWLVGLVFIAGSSAMLMTGCGSDDTGTGSSFVGDNDHPNQDPNQDPNENQDPDHNQDPDQNQDPDHNQDEPPEPLQPADAPDIITSIGTIASEATVSAGESVDIECVYYNPAGEIVETTDANGSEERLILFPNDTIEVDDGAITPTQAGEAKVACQSIDLGLTDPDPEIIQVEPAAVHTTTTTLSDHQIVAGNEVSAECEAFDVYGNKIEDVDFELVADTSSSGIVIDDTTLVISLTAAGLFGFDCHVEGTAQRFGDTVEVLPDKPSELFADPVPFQTTYGIGQVITVGTDVRDRFGNKISHPEIEFAAAPMGENFGDGRFRFHYDGVYTLSAEVVEETHNDVTLYEEFDVVINATGPDINCTYPADGEMVDHTPGTPLTFEGTTADEHGVQSIIVNGQELGGIAKGGFSADIDTRYGINFVNIVATDEYGEENVRTCAFLLSEAWAEEDDFIDDAISLALFQDAVDDKNYQGPNNIRSLNDLILTVINSEGLRQEIEDQIRAGNPYEVDQCNFDVYVNAVYFDGDPHITALDLIGGGIGLFARFNDVYIDLTLRDGSWYCFGPYHPTIVLEYVELKADTELLLSNNLPALQLDQDSVEVTSGEVDAEGGNWFSDWVYGAITDLFQGTFRGIVEDTFEDAITDNFDDLFDGLMSSIDIDSLATQFDVPQLDSDESMTLDFAFNFSHSGATSARALFGIAPKITAAGGAAHGIDSLGVAHPAGDMLMDSSSNSAAAAAHVALLNQALHALWRGGLLDADIGGSLGDDIPDGAAVELDARLPPLVVLGNVPDEGAEIMLGAVRVDLQYPGIFDEPVTFMVGATATTTISLQDEVIDFGNVQLNEFHLSPQYVSINEGTRDILEDFLGGLFQDIVDQSLNAALPSLPIPSFTVPASMAAYDLPANGEVGLFNTSMGQSARHIELHGEFGIE